MSRRLAFPLLASMILSSAAALGAEGRTPIPFAAPVATPIVIGTPGSYVVTRNLSATGPGPVITIAVPPGAAVELDLNGMVLSGAPGFPVIDVPGAGSEVTIRNGATVGGDQGILVFGPSRKIVIEQVQVTDAVLSGIRVNDAEGYVVRDNVVSDIPGGFGIAIESGVRQGKVTGNLVRRTSDGICIFTSGGVEVSGNHVKEVLPGGAFGAGILIDASQAAIVAQNTVDTAGGPIDGIRVQECQGCKLVNNVVNRAGRDGIAVISFAAGIPQANLVLDNVVTNCGDDGIFIDSTGNKVERNTSNFNGQSGIGYGFRFGGLSGANVVGDNLANANSGGPCVFPFSPDYCDDAAPPGAINVSQGDNFVPPGFGPF